MCTDGRQWHVVGITSWGFGCAALGLWSVRKSWESSRLGGKGTAVYLTIHHSRCFHKHDWAYKCVRMIAKLYKLINKYVKSTCCYERNEFNIFFSLWFDGTCHQRCWQRIWATVVRSRDTLEIKYKTQTLTSNKFCEIRVFYIERFFFSNLLHLTQETKSFNYFITPSLPPFWLSKDTSISPHVVLIISVAHVLLRTKVSHDVMMACKTVSWVGRYLCQWWGVIEQLEINCSRSS